MTNKQPRYIQSCISSQYFHCVTPYLPQQIKVIHLIPLRVGFQKPLKLVFEGRYRAKKNSRWLANRRGKQNQENLLYEDQYTMYGYFLEQFKHCFIPDLNPKQHQPQEVQPILLFSLMIPWRCFMTGSLWQIQSALWKVMPRMAVMEQQQLMTMFYLLVLRRWEQVL